MARRKARALAPLAHARLWHRPPERFVDGWGETRERTSQRLALRAVLGPGVLIGILLGGNRSGKSEAGGQWIVAQALGSDHPHVVEWARLNGFDLRSIPAGPGTCWAVSLTFPDSVQYVREKIARYCPPGTVYRNWAAENVAEAILPNGGRIVCKAWTQGRKGMQGAGIRAAWCDEEPPDAPAFDELLLRVADQRGRVLCTYTPLSGLTYLYHRYVRTVRPGVTVYAINGEDNPHVPSAVLRTIIAQTSERMRRARRAGAYTALEGLIWPEFRRDLHVVPAFAPPADWPRLRGIDFGTRNPFACVWVAWDRADDVYHVYREYYATELTTEANGRAVLGRETEADRKAHLRSFADPESRDGRMTLLQRCGLRTFAARKDVLEGINAVGARLAPDANGKPHLVIHDSCPQLIAEVEGYIWEPGPMRERPRKENDHGCDAMRYVVFSNDILTGRVQGVAATSEGEAA